VLTGDEEIWFRQMHKDTDGSDEWKKIQSFTERHTYKWFRLAHKDTNGSDKCTEITEKCINIQMVWVCK
jgi:hypothetical protein